ncbi:MAG TPA: hypothetical protein VFZ59_09620 [Verrucomicrobiae bacterium]|nr:hypothetical protein [Verrucomicrobiae bacterium]
MGASEISGSRAKQKSHSRQLSSMIRIALLAGACLLAGCSSGAYVIARQNAQYQLSATNKITIADHAHPGPEEQSLRKALMSELRQKGFHLVSSEEADYALTYWIDVSWKRGKIVVPGQEATPVIVPGAPGGGNSSHRVPPRLTPVGTYYDSSPLGIQHVVEVPWETKGIRLKVFPQASLRAGNLQTAWDGYIEVGKEVSDAREPVLVRTLLNYLGTDFIGKARLAAAPAQQE